MPGGRACDPSFCERRERSDATQVLVVSLPALPNESKVHNRQLPTNRAVGARARAREDADVRTEISLAVLAYNMKRMIKIMGAHGMVRAISA